MTSPLTQCANNVIFNNLFTFLLISCFFLTLCKLSYAANLLHAQMPRNTLCMGCYLLLNGGVTCDVRGIRDLILIRRWCTPIYCSCICICKLSYAANLLHAQMPRNTLCMGCYLLLNGGVTCDVRGIRDLILIRRWCTPIYCSCICILIWALLIPATRWSCSRPPADSNACQLQPHLVAGVRGARKSA